METIQPNMNRLFRPLFGTEANTKQIVGTAIQIMLRYKQFKCGYRTHVLRTASAFSLASSQKRSVLFSIVDISPLHRVLNLQVFALILEKRIKYPT